MASTDTHLSASYIHSTIGPRFIPMPVGVILDPLHVDITCVYPTDAGTDGRDNDGCGPSSYNPKYGSKGAEKAGIIGRWMAKRAYEWYTRDYYGNRTWEEISCTELFQLPEALVNGTVWKAKVDDDYKSCNSEGYLRAARHTVDIAARQGRSLAHVELEYTSLAADIAWEFGALLGHPPCEVESQTIEQLFDEYHWFEYGGTCSWKPHQFEQMMDSMRNDFIKPHPKMSISWNEIVAAKPRSNQEERNSIAAVFYVKYPSESDEVIAEARQLAEREAKRFGRKPVLEVDLSSYWHDEDHFWTSPLFKCAD